MMELLGDLVSPLTALLELGLETIYPLVGSYGLSIILLSLAVSLALSPIAGYARSLEARDQERQRQMAPRIAAIKSEYRGRERFERIDAVYQEHRYHPIKSLGSLLPLLVQIPFLLAALFLLVHYEPLRQTGFLFIPDLSRPDHLIPNPFSETGFNLLPLALTAVALIDSCIRKESTRQSRIRFLIVSVVLLVLIYPFPAGVCLYWLTANSFVFGRSLWARLRSAPRRGGLRGSGA